MRKAWPFAVAALLALVLLVSHAGAVSEFKAAIRFGEAASWATAVAGSPGVTTSEGVYVNSTNHHLFHHMPDGTEVDITLLAQAAAGTLTGYVAVNNNGGSSLTTRTTLELAPRLAAADSSGHASTVLDLATTGIGAGTYAAGAITVDVYGRVTAGSTGTTAVSPGAYNLANITVDQYGRITTAATGNPVGSVTAGHFAQALGTVWGDTHFAYSSGPVTDYVSNVQAGMTFAGLQSTGGTGGTVAIVAAGGNGLADPYGGRVECSNNGQRCELEIAPAMLGGYRIRLENWTGSLSGNYPEWQFWNYNAGVPIKPFGISNTLIYSSVAMRAAALIESTSGGFKFPDGTIQTTAGSTLSGLTSGRIPVATGAAAIGNSGLTFAGTTLDSTTATLTLGGTMTALQWAAGGAKSISVATSAVDTAGTSVSVSAGAGGAASATGAGVGGTYTIAAVAGGAGTATLAGGAAGGISLTGAIGGGDSGAGGGAGTTIAITAGGGRSGAASTGSAGAIAGPVTITGTQSGNGGSGLTNGNGGNAASGPAWSWTSTRGGDGGTGNGTGNGGNAGNGSALTIKTGAGGQGGAGTVPGNSGSSGNIVVQTGNAGLVQGSNTGASSGSITIDVGTPTGTSTAGTIAIGASSSAITVGGNGKSYTLSALFQGALPSKVGTAIASASTIAPTALTTHITGTTAINTITPPTVLAQTGGGGCFYLIPDAAFTTGTSGNIAIASTAVVGRLMIMCYDNATTKWYPNY